jgi:hypothetical protein
MKRFILLGFLLLSACQASPAATPQPGPTRSLPTPVPATPTPTLIPSPTLTSTPPPRYFIEDFEGLPAYWSTLYASGGNGNTEVYSRSGWLHFELSDPNTWVYAIFGAHEYESVHIETRIENRASDVHYAGLLCFYDEQAGWIEFNLSGDGTFNLLFGQWLAEGIARYTPILYDTSPYILTDSPINDMGLDCYEGIVQLYFNGKLFRKLDVSRFELSRGKVGLAVASFEITPVILGFDWVKVSEIDSPLP